MPSMNRALQVLALTLLITAAGLVHVGAKLLVQHSVAEGLFALIAIFAALPWMSRYLD